MWKVQCSLTKNKLGILKGLKGFFVLSDLRSKGSSIYFFALLHSKKFVLIPVQA